MERLPVELLELINSHLSYADRMALHHTNPHMSSPMIEFAEKYLPCEWSVFSEQLRCTEAVIGGSTALRFFSYVDFRPNDLDIYGPIHNLPHWEDFFRNHGFQENRLARQLIYYCGANSVKKLEYTRGSMVVQYIYGLPANDVDNTANRCTLSNKEALCPHYNDVKENTTVFHVHNAFRIAKMMARGFKVKPPPPEPATIKTWLLDIFVKRRTKDAEHRVKLV